MPRIAITGAGAITPIGMSVPEVLNSLLTLRSGIRKLESDGLVRPLPVASVNGTFDEKFKRLELPFLDRFTRMALLAADQACEQAGIPDFEAYDQRAGVFFGTVRGGGHTEWDNIYRYLVEKQRSVRPYVIMGTMANAPASQVSIRRKILGPVAVHSTACSSSGNAVADACRHIAIDELDVALVGGSEAALNPMFLSAWEGLRALTGVNEQDPSSSCRPFSASRGGLVLGEGAVMFVLESEEHAKRRGAQILGYVDGWGIASDAYHIGAPNSRGQLAALRKALSKAEVDASEVDYINAHATATKGGDPVEVATLKELLGPDVERIPVSGTKALHGHMLGAASAMELLVCLLAIQEQFLPATAFLEDIDPDCMGIRHVQETVRNVPVRRALSLSAGFGGTNSALLLSQA